MTKNDDLILEFLQEKDIALPPGPLHYNLEREGYTIGYSTVRRRIKKLESAGLIQDEAENGTQYSITDKGRAYLAGELDAEELENDEV